MALNALVMHGPVEASEGADMWWDLSQAVARMLPRNARSIFFVDANGRVGDPVRVAIGPVHAEVESGNGQRFHSWLAALGLCAFSTFKCRGEGGTWRSSSGALRRIDYICGPQELLSRNFVTWVDFASNVSTKRDDHFPAILEIAWQPSTSVESPSWCRPLCDRASLSNASQVEAFTAAMSLVPAVPPGVDLNAHHAFLFRLLQVQGATFFLIPTRKPKESWISRS